MRVEAGMVVCETVDLATEAWATFRAVYPEVPLTVIESSPPGSACPKDMLALAAGDPLSRVILAGKNVGHGPGMHRILDESEAEAVLLFDSDVTFHRGGFLEPMAALLTSRTLAVGQVLKLDRSYLDHMGLRNEPAKLPYVHPALHLVQRSVYLRCAPYRQHGAPCLATAIDARRLRFTCRDFPVWDYAVHAGRGTRNELTKQGLPVSYAQARSADLPRQRKGVR